jgi:hypothetical protein
MGTGQLLAGNLANLVIALLAFLQIIPWPVAGYLIIGSVIVVVIASLRSKAEVPSSEGAIARHETIVREPGIQRPSPRLEKKTINKTTGPREPTPRILTPRVSPNEEQVEGEPAEGRPGEGPATIGDGDYLSYDVDLEKGEEVVGEVSASGDVNVYVLNEDNLDALDMGQEFWYDAGSEGVRSATVRFTAPEDGEWFLVVENDNNREVNATVKMSVGRPSHSPPSLKTDGLDLPDAKLEGKM